MFPVGTKAVIGTAIIRIFQHLVGFVDLFEFLLSIGILIDIRMIASGKLTISFLDLGGISVARYTQYLIIILVFHADPD